MTKRDKLKILMICHTIQKHKQHDISSIGKVRKMTAREISKINKKLGIYKSEMNIVKVVNY